MRVAFNAQLADFTPTYRGAGVSNYIWRLLKGISDVDPSNRYLVFTQRDSKTHLGSICGSNRFDIRCPAIPTKHPLARIIWEQFVLPAAVKYSHILHCPVNVMPLLSSVPTVITVHDLAFYVFTDKHIASKRTYLRAMTRISCHRASSIITVSESTKKDVTRYLGVDGRKVTPIHIAAGDEFRWLGASPSGHRLLEEYRSKHNLPAEFVLYVGTIEPRKNIPALLQSYACFARQAGGHTDLPPLVLAGARGWLNSDLQRLAGELGISDCIRYLGYVPSEELPLLMNSATIFVYLSQYEGFGLPPLEAMACGLPVVASNMSSLPEVVGEAGILVDPSNVEETAWAIRRLVSSPEERERLRAEGLKRASLFSWRETAAATVRAYERVCSATSGR